MFCKISWKIQWQLRIPYNILKFYLLSDHIRRLTQRSSLVQTRCQVLHRSQGCRSSAEEPSPEGHLGNTWAQIIMKGTQGYIAEKIDKIFSQKMSNCPPPVPLCSQVLTLALLAEVERGALWLWGHFWVSNVSHSWHFVGDLRHVFLAIWGFFSSHFKHQFTDWGLESDYLGIGVSVHKGFVGCLVKKYLK